jgi:predicted PurR-regulated permease PerM
MSSTRLGTTIPERPPNPELPAHQPMAAPAPSVPKVDRLPRDRSLKTLLLLCTLVLVFSALYFARAIIAPVTLSLFIIAVAWPLQSALERRMPKLLALTVTILTILAIIAVLEYLVMWGFSHVVQWLIANADRLQALYTQATGWLDEHGISVSSLVAENYNSSWIIGAAREIGSRGYRLISFAVIAFTFTVLGLLEVDSVRKKIGDLEEPGVKNSLLTAAKDIAAKFQKYMLVRSLMSALTGVVVWCFALAAGIELATAWGVIAFVLNYIPFIGPLIATIFPTLFALVQSGSWQLAVMVFACLNIIQFLIGSYLEPRIAGAALYLSPFAILFAIFFWSFLWGVAGAFIGVPILIALLTVCEEYKSARWIAVLLSGRSDERT